MQKILSFMNSKGDKLVGVIEGELNPTRPMVITCHGHSSNKDRPSTVSVAKRLREKGLDTFRFDFYGHGESEGEFANATISEVMDDVLQAIKYVKSLGYKKIGLVGSSFGGLACILAAAESKDIFALALKSPVSNYANLYQDVDLDDWKQRGYIPYPEHPDRLTLNYIFYTDAVKRDGYAVANKIMVPTLIVHGDQDLDVPIAQSQKLVKLIPHGELKTIHGADHRYTNEDHTKQMLRAITEFIVKQS